MRDSPGCSCSASSPSRARNRPLLRAATTTPITQAAGLDAFHSTTPDSTKSGCLLVSWSSAFLDADLDGLDDLLVLNGHISFREAQPTVMFRGVGAGRFTEVSPSIACMEGRGLVPADLDDDGDLDLITTSRTGPVFVYRTDALAGRHWLRVRLRGSQSNPEGIGALVRLTTQSGRQLVRPVGAGGLVHAVEPVEVDRVLEITEAP